MTIATAAAAAVAVAVVVEYPSLIESVEYFNVDNHFMSYRNIFKAIMTRSCFF